MKYVCIWLIRLYQKVISPLRRRPCCRFTPSCSAYGIEAYRKRGFFAGTVLTVSRIARCNPFCAGGYDPVPEKGFSSKKEREAYAAYLRDTYGDLFDESLRRAEKDACTSRKRKRKRLEKQKKKKNRKQKRKSR